jgi:uncharacterized protein (UPF0332 family)
MRWSQLLAERKVVLHASSKQEVDALRALVERDLSDAAIPALSADRRFATAYNAALQTAKIAVACAGYRVMSRPGHHRFQFEAASIALGPGAHRILDYFDICRRKRNVIDYDAAFVATETEAEEILKEAKAFRAFVEHWIVSTHPSLAKT